MKQKGVAVRVIDIYCVKPLDAAALAAAVRATGGRQVTDEDNYPEGGLGEAVVQSLAESGVQITALRQLAVTRVPHSGKPDELIEAFGISAKHRRRRRRANSASQELGARFAGVFR